MKLYIMILVLGFIVGFKLAEKVYKPMSQSKLVQAVNKAVTSAECTENVYKYTYKQYQRQVLDEYVALLNFIINTNMSDEQIIEHHSNIYNKLKILTKNKQISLEECALRADLH